jgi:hypothetical protein
MRSYIICLIIKLTSRSAVAWDRGGVQKKAGWGVVPHPALFYQSRSHPGNMPVEMAMRFQLLMVLITMMSVTNCVSS